MDSASVQLLTRDDHPDARLDTSSPSYAGTGTRVLTTRELRVLLRSCALCISAAFAVLMCIVTDGHLAEDSSVMSPECKAKNCSHGLCSPRPDKKNGAYTTAVRRWWKHKQCPLWERCIANLEAELQSVYPDEKPKIVLTALAAWKMQYERATRPRSFSTEKCTHNRTSSLELMRVSAAPL